MTSQTSSSTWGHFKVCSKEASLHGLALDPSVLTEGVSLIHMNIPTPTLSHNAIQFGHHNSTLHSQCIVVYKCSIMIIFNNNSNHVFGIVTFICITTVLLHSFAPICDIISGIHTIESM